MARHPDRKVNVGIKLGSKIFIVLNKSSSVQPASWTIYKNCFYRKCCNYQGNLGKELIPRYGAQEGKLAILTL